MPVVSATVRRLSSKAVVSLNDFSSPAGRPTPHNLQYSHILGSGQFSLFGEGPQHSKLQVRCVVTTQHVRADRRRRGGGQVRSVRRAVDDTEFDCQLTNVCRGFPLALSLRCSTRAGLLIINGASFSQFGAVSVEGPESATRQFDYHGPHMNQGHLADLVIGRKPPVSPLTELSNSETSFFRIRGHFDSSQRSWFGHTPVHTVKPEVADAIAQVVCLFGVDDDLADYVQWRARIVQKLEEDSWRKTMLTVPISS